MQYILTHEEFIALVSKTKYEKEKEKVKKLNQKVLEVTGYPCIHNTGFGYCDFCPLSELDTCNLSKSYSK
jgi:hypothetical protein